jgi:ATP-binding cassette subfamily B protein
MGRALALMWRVDKFIAVINIFLQFAQAVLPILSLYFLKELIESITRSDKAFNTILWIILSYGLIQVLIVIINNYSSYINAIHQHKLIDKLSAEVLEKAIKVDYAYYENATYHDSMHLAQQQATYKATQLLSNFNAMLMNSLSLLFLILFFLSLHSLFALFFITLSIPLALVKWHSGYALLQMERKFVPMERETNYLHQILTGTAAAKEVRLFAFGDAFIIKFKNLRHIIFHQKTELNAKLTWYSLSAEIAEVIAMIFIFTILAKQTWEKTITIGAFVIYLQGFQRLQSTAKGFLQALVQVFQQRLFLNDLFKFLDLSTDTYLTGDKSFPIIHKGVSIRNLSFTYPEANKPALNNINMECRPGTITAIVGENGSGKSTLVKLMGRLYQMQQGNIKIEDELISNISYDDFSKNCVFLFQDYEKYFFSITENITLGDEGIKTMEKVEHAAKLAGAHEFIQNLSKGYETRIGKLFSNSEQLSGGQWQKLALARAFYKKAQLMVLDEPTSALDASAEFDVFNNIKTELSDNMIFLITHKLYNLKIADYIYVLKDGKVVQEGKFEELIVSEGLFKELYKKQKLN